MPKIQPRDLKLFSHLSRYGVLSSRQILELSFPGIAPTTAMRRLRLLKEEGLIRRLEGLPDAMTAWVLTKPAARQYGLPEPARYSNRNTLLHEVTLSSVRMALEAIGLGEEWTSETELRRKLSGVSVYRDPNPQLIPDGIFLAKQAGEPCAIAVELELTPKNHLRYRKLFEEYRGKGSVAWIWYIAATPAIGTLVLKRWQEVKKYRPRPVLIVSLLDEILSDSSRAKILGLDSQATTVGTFFSPLAQVIEPINSMHRAAPGVSREELDELSTQAPPDLQSNQDLPSPPAS